MPVYYESAVSDADTLAQVPIDDLTDADGNRLRLPERPAPPFMVGQAQRHKGAQHHHVTLGEIHRLGGLVDQDESHRDQTIDTAICQSTDQKL